MDFEDLKPLVILDPLMLPLLVHVCPIEELPGVIAVIPPYLSAARLVKILFNLPFIHTDRVYNYVYLCMFRFFSLLSTVLLL